MVDPDMGTWTYAYNPLGQLISQTDALSQTQWFGYDGLGRMTEKRVGGPSGALLVSYLYDQGKNGIGRRSAMTDTTGYTAWSYDLRGQVTMTQKLIAPNPAAYVTKFGYDDANRVITVSYPGGDVVTNTPAFAGAGSSTWRGNPTGYMRRGARS